MGESELVLQSRDVHARPDPAVPLPVQADEDVGLREVGPVQLARWVRSGAELEQHRRESQGRDGTGHRATLVRRARPAWSSRRRADADPGCGSRHWPAARRSSIRLRAIHRRILCGRHVRPRSSRRSPISWLEPARPLPHERRLCGCRFIRRARGTACPSRRCRWRARRRHRCRRSSPSAPFRAG